MAYYLHTILKKLLSWISGNVLLDFGSQPKDYPKSKHAHNKFSDMQCCICGEPLNGKYYIDWDGNKACEKHKDSFCNSCHRFYGNNATEVEKGIFLCSSCMSHQITPQSAEYVVGRIRYFYRHVGIEVKSNIVLRVLSSRDLTRLAGEECQGYAEYPATKDGYRISTLRHLSQSAFASVMAHEILHVWQYENHIFPPEDICEGFCNLGAYLFMKSIGSATAAGLNIQMEMDTSEVYGKGFAKMKTLYDNNGISGVISEIKKY